MNKRLYYKKTPGGLMLSDKVLVGLTVYHAQIDKDLNTSIVTIDTLDNPLVVGTFKDLTKAKQAAKRKLIELGAKFIPETRRPRAKTNPREL